MKSRQHITQICLIMCIRPLPQGTRLCRYNRFCEQTELPSCFYQRGWRPWKGTPLTNCLWIWHCPPLWVNQTLPFTCCHCLEQLQRQHLQPSHQIPRKDQEALADSNLWKERVGRKAAQAKAVVQVFQQVSSTKPWKLLRNSDFVGHTISQTGVAKQRQEKAAPKESICAQQSRGVSNPIRFKTIVEAAKVSPKAGPLKDNRSAKFLH